MIGTQSGIDQVEVVPGVDHEGDRVSGSFIAGQLTQRGMIDGRVSRQNVGGGEFGGEPQRLGQRVAHDSGESRHVQHPLEQIAAPD